ncbi:hypothetical protein HanRHA438_Chr04g0174161 [Helianthus annuus]|uniref:Uncharacterized protein n=1 Tax=Helianthus annuus TaxID=4232 RepID=A0A251RRB4_HELAN|nr:hypothetical protein HanXRQr2_Chr17g0812161 [Helianthus annuus]KAF5810022.1 hypothetical protein HanXRQr2_Chr04g0164441 [Helianthus annuus]KAF5810023.1 hypothetical protein HanXRQr2_Chr04g0164451 [Helianthus annuus]KAJ0580931.1 hypothetical protein HanHA300_Chr04g0135091 [Helianthus annuus]KAJ0588679.1 hypothetical protein HanIR_Chr04g0177471 [Helianthus annuus]
MLRRNRRTRGEREPSEGERERRSTISSDGPLMAVETSGGGGDHRNSDPTKITTGRSCQSRWNTGDDRRR